MIPLKSFPGSSVISVLLKIFAILIGLSGLTIMILLAMNQTATGINENFEKGVKLFSILGTFVISGSIASLIAAAACGLDIARDSNYRVGMSAQIAAAATHMGHSSYAPSPSYIPPAGGAAPSQFSSQQ